MGKMYRYPKGPILESRLLYRPFKVKSAPYAASMLRPKFDYHHLIRLSWLLTVRRFVKPHNLFLQALTAFHFGVEVLRVRYAARKAPGFLPSKRDHLVAHRLIQSMYVRFPLG